MTPIRRASRDSRIRPEQDRMTSEPGAITTGLEVPGAGRVTALLLRPSNANAALVLAHGAGAGMRHPFMEALAERLASRSVATLRYQFPYMERGGGPPDAPAVLTATVRAAVAVGAERLKGLPLFAGGKSLGGRMTSTAAATEALARVRGLVFFGFPLHPPGRPGISRTKHLDDVTTPMLFVQGTRDALAGLDLIRPLCQHLGPGAELHVIEGADHSFSVLKRSGRTNDVALDELADVASVWMRRVAKGEGLP